jgi:hypothetical protein
MKRLTPSYLLPLLAFLVAFGCGSSSTGTGQEVPPKDKEVDITGHYTWEGIKEGEDYAISKNGEVYQVFWRLKAGDWIGVAIRDGDRLSVAWDKPTGGNLGVAVYKIEKGAKGPSLVGSWAAYEDKKATKDSYKWSKKLD